MNITMCISRIAACCFGALVPGLACAAVSFAPPRLPTCAFADTEASSNFVFGTGTDLDRNWILAIEADVSSNNNVQVEFGVDRDGSGALSVDERELAVGWDCGEWVLRDRRGDVERRAAERPGRRKVVLRLVLDEDRSVRSAASVFRDVDISNLFSPEWNMARVVVRGERPVGEVVKSVLFPHPFVLRLR